MSLAGRLQRFLDKHGVHYTESKKSFITACLSPSCGKEDHCYIRKSDGRSICFRCGSKWNWKRMVSAIVGCRFEDAYEAFWGSGAGEEVEKPLDVELLFNLGEDEEEEEFSEQPIVLGPDLVCASTVMRAVDYLVTRGVENLSVMFNFNLKYHAMMDAVVFPVMREGKIYGWQARRIDPKEGELRLISHRSFSKSKFLLNYDRAKTQSNVVLVEGPFDCLHVDLLHEGIIGVASLGKSISMDQIKLILDLKATHVYLGLDPDASSEVYEVIRRIGYGKNLFRIMPPKHRKDFGECNEKEVMESVLSAIPVTAQSDILDVYLK